MANKRTYSDRPHDVPGLPEDAFLIVPSDTYDYVTDDVYGNGIEILVAVTGNITVTPASGNDDIVLTGVPAFYILPFKVRKVTTDTTATCIGLG